MDVADWGEINVVKVQSGKQFVRLFDELKDCDKELPDGTGFHNNLSTLIDAYKDGDLYTLTVEENLEMSKAKTNTKNPLFVKFGWYELPCMMVMDQNGACDILWVHRRARGMGFARKLVENVKCARGVLPSATGFWGTMDIDYTV